VLWALTLIAEDRIKDAVERGELDNLPGKGRPLTGLGDADHLPPELRMAFRMLKTSGCLPDEYDTSKPAEKIQTTRDLLSGMDEEDERLRKIQKFEFLVDKANAARRTPVLLDETAADKATERLSLNSKADTKS
jgi:hypothetical protein